MVKEEEKAAKSEQKELNDLTVVMDTVALGVDYWNRLLAVGIAKSLVSYQEQTAVKQVIMMATTGNVPVSSSGKVPYKTMNIIKMALDVKDKLESEGIKI